MQQHRHRAQRELPFTPDSPLELAVMAPASVFACPPSNPILEDLRHQQVEERHPILGGDAVVAPRGAVEQIGLGAARAGETDDQPVGPGLVQLPERRDLSGLRRESHGVGPV
jgi:hypothetical protein